MKDKAYDLMSKKKAASDKTAKKQAFNKKEEAGTEALLSKINNPLTEQKTSPAHVENIRKTEGGLIFDVITKTNGGIIKDVFIPTEKIYSQKNQLAQERIMETERKQRKMIEFFIIYPVAIVSSIIIIHGFMTILPVVQKILSTY